MCRAERSISCALMCLVLSLVSLILGFSLVLVLMWHIVIPSLDAKTAYRTQCIVHRIYTDTQQDPGGLEDGISDLDIQNQVYMNTKHEGYTSVENDGNVGHMPNVTGFGLYNITSLGSTDAHSQNKAYMFESTFVGSCIHVLVLFRIPGRNNKIGRLYPAKAYDSETLNDKCFCSDCLAVVAAKGQGIQRVHLRDAGSVSHDPKVLNLGDMLKCYHYWHSVAPAQSRTMEPTLQGWKVMMAMFWPTLLFISGFVGLFFSSIILAESLSESRNTRHQRDIETHGDIK